MESSERNKISLYSVTQIHIVTTCQHSHRWPYWVGPFLHFVWVVDDAKCIVVTHVCVCVCVCLSTAARPHYCTNPDVTWGHGRGCPLVVHYWVDLQSAHGLHCYDNITRTLVTSFHPSCDMTTWPAGDGGVLKIVHRIWQVGVAGWPVTGRRRGGVLNITASAWIAGFQW